MIRKSTIEQKSCRIEIIKELDFWWIALLQWVIEWNEIVIFVDYSSFQTHHFCSCQLRDTSGNDRRGSASAFSCRWDSSCYPNTHIVRFSAQTAEKIYKNIVRIELRPYSWVLKSIKPKCVQAALKYWIRF